MVCTANDLSAWKDFPKGLRVLLLNHDSDSAAEIKSKLESMDYIVSTFCNEDDALSAFSSGPESFHIAIVEVNRSNENGSFKFLETAKGLPIIMTSDIHCLSTMMKCIALGAVEFLLKPLTDDKLKNIWQHVFKAFNSGVRCCSESLRPVEDSVVDEDHFVKADDAFADHENDSEESLHSDKYPAPSTPQLKDGDFRDNTNSSIGESTKSVETTCGNSVAETAIPIGETEAVRESKVKEEDELADGSNSDNSIHSNPQSKDNHKDSHTAEKRKAGSDPLDGKKAHRKKFKVDWTPGLHKKFVQAVEQLGIDQAIPSLILEKMKVEGLTRHNVASHLQKYRMHKRHILPKEERKWLQKDHIAPRSCKPIMPFPPLPAGQMYPMWGARPHPATVPMWGPPGYPSWQPAETWHWSPYPGMHADAWGCPVMPPPPPPQGFYPPYAQNANNCFNTSIPQSHHIDFQLDEEEIDKVVKEVVNKPWLPLPLGLKPPSTESVLAELSRQGICSVPPHAEGAYSY